MVVVAIVGILTTVALPGFTKTLLRTKTAERATIMLRIKQAVQEHYVRTGTALPQGEASPLDSGFNPPGAPTMQKQTMATNLANWNKYFSTATGGSSLPAEIEGGVYYRYWFQVAETPSSATITIIAQGDLDGDGVLSTKRFDYTRSSGVYQLTNEAPPPGFEDDAGPDATF
jgi:Tfp pilus assembly protein PilE